MKPLLSSIASPEQSDVQISQEEFIDNYIAMESSLNMVEAILKQSDHALDVAVSMENIVEVLDQIDTVTPMHNALIMIAGDLSVAGTDIEPEAVVPSMESDDASGKEGMKEKLKARVKMILNTIKEFLAKAWEYFKSLFDQVSRFSSATNQRADAFKKRYLTIEANTKKKVNAFVVRPILENDRTVTDPAAVLAGLDKYMGMIGRLESDASKMRTQLATVGDALIQVTEVKISDDKIGQVLSELHRDISNYNDEVALFGGWKARMNKPQIGTNELWHPTGAEALFSSTRFKIIPPDDHDAVDHQVPDMNRLAKMIDDFKEINSFLSPTASHGIHFIIKNSEKVIKDFENKADGVWNFTGSKQLGTEFRLDWCTKLPAYSAMLSSLLVGVPTLCLRNTLVLTQRLSTIIDLSLKAYGA